MKQDSEARKLKKKQKKVIKREKREVKKATEIEVKKTREEREAKAKDYNENVKDLDHSSQNIEFEQMRNCLHNPQCISREPRPPPIGQNH